jgi:Mn-dependent DtxR family transcriptional regulator
LLKVVEKVMSTTETADNFGTVLGDNVRSRMVQLLMESGDPIRRHEIADTLDVSQAMVSRTASELLDAGVITATEDRELMLTEPVYAGVSQINAAINPENYAE